MCHSKKTKTFWVPSFFVSGNGDLTGKCHDTEPEQERGKNEETDHDNFDTLHISSFPPPWAEISSYDIGGWFCTASTNRMVSPI